MRRTYAFLFLVVVVGLMSACGDHGHSHDQAGDHSHDDHDQSHDQPGADAHDDHGHPHDEPNGHAHDEPSTVAVTHWTDLNLFVYPIVGIGTGVGIGYAASLCFPRPTDVDGLTWRTLRSTLPADALSHSAADASVPPDSDHRSG